MKRDFARTRWIAASVALMAFAVTRSIIWGGDEVAGAYVQEPAIGHQAMYIDQAAHAPATGLVPRISVGDRVVSMGETVSVPVMLSQAPEGLAGFLIEFSLSDSSVARISDVEFPDFGLTYDAPIADGSMRLAAVDLYKLIESDAANSTLVWVNITGLSGGATSLELQVIKIDDDSGDTITPEIASGTLSVY